MKGAWMAWMAAAAAMLAAGCDNDGEAGPGGGGVGLPEETVASYEGIYEMSVLTENPSACEGGGMDLLATSMDSHVVLVGFEQLGAPVLKLMSCEDVADCQGKADAIRNMMGVGFMFGADLSEQVSDDELRGFAASTGYEEGGMCMMRKYEDHRLTRSGDTITLETETKTLADKPAEDGFCSVQPSEAQQEADGAPCTSLLVIEAARVAAASSAAPRSAGPRGRGSVRAAAAMRRPRTRHLRLRPARSH